MLCLVYLFPCRFLRYSHCGGSKRRIGWLMQGRNGRFEDKRHSAVTINQATYASRMLDILYLVHNHKFYDRERIRCHCVHSLVEDTRWGGSKFW